MPPRLAILLSLLLAAIASAKDDDASVLDITYRQLHENPKKYDGKLIRFDAIVRQTPTAPETSSKRPCVLKLNNMDDLPLNMAIECAVRPEVKKGDRVRVTGRYAYQGRLFVPHFLAVEPPHGKVEKLPAKEEKTPAKDTKAVTFRAPDGAS